MLEKLDNINWAELKHAYGSAYQVPTWIRNLVTYDSKIIEDTLFKLKNHLHHQGTIYEATVATIPFLIELLTIENVECKPSILSFLRELSYRYYSNAAFDSIWSWNSLASQEVSKGREIYMKLLNHSDHKVRLHAVLILSNAPRFDNVYAKEIFDAMKNTFAEETKEIVKAALITGFGNLAVGYRSQLIDQLVDITQVIKRFQNNEANHNLSLVALLALPKLMLDQISQETIDALVSIVLVPPMRYVPAAFGSPDLLAVKSLYYIDEERRLEAMQAAMSRIDDGLMQSAMPRIDDGFRALLIASALLDWTFLNRGPILPNYDIDIGKDTKSYKYFVLIKKNDINHLTELQRRVVKAIIEVDSVWIHQHNLFETYGFTASRDELRHLLNSD